MRPEVDAGRDRDPRLLEKTEHQGLAVVREALATGVHVESTLWHQRYAKPECPERRYQEVAPALKFCAARFEDLHRLGPKRGERRVLGGRRYADERVLCKPLQLAHVIRWRHEPAEPPSGHAEVLGEAVDDEQIRREPERRRAARAVVAKPVVNLVHQDEAAPSLDLCQDFA